MADPSSTNSVPLGIERVEGRWPFHPRPLKPENISATVTQVDAHRDRNRIGDSANDEAWLEILVKHDVGNVDDTVLEDGSEQT